MKRNLYIREINNSLDVLKKGKIILYPTDTIWGLSCDIRAHLAIEKIYKIKKRDYSKPFILLVENIRRLEEWVYVPQKAKELIENHPKPLTIVYDKIKKKIPFFDQFNSLAIRLTKDYFSKKLIMGLDSPIISTSANLSHKPSPCCFDQIDPLVLQDVDYRVNVSRKKKSLLEASSIIKVSMQGDMEIIRK